MIAYPAKVQDHLLSFKNWQIKQIFRAQNAKVDSLAKITSGLSFELNKMIPVEYLSILSFHDKELLILATELKDRWQALIIQCLRDGMELASKKEAKKLRYKASHYLLINEVLHK